jgi:hypothetical protein
VRVQLIRVHEDGSCAKWRTDPDDLKLVLVIPAKPKKRDS